MVYTALLMGLVGSFHCAGMCSPLVMAVTTNKPFLLSGIIYNSGRIVVYALLGALAAAFGSMLHIAPYQQFLSGLLGLLFLWSGLGVSSIRIPFIGKGIALFANHTKKLFGFVLHKKSWITTFLLGMINGLLPCGLTYLALTACLILPTATSGFLFMIYFGLGTWPVMIGLIKLLDLTKLTNRFSLARFSKIGMVLVGCMLLLRVFWVHPHTPDFLTKSVDPVSVCK